MIAELSALILCIFCTVWLLICFRYFKIFNVNTFQAIVVNYVVCVVTGWISLDKEQFATYQLNSTTWLWISGVLGSCFISTFYLIGLTAQRAGVTVASLANKMSMVIPVMVSLFFLEKSTAKTFSAVNYLGIVVAMLAVVMSSYKKEEPLKQEPGNSSTSSGSLFSAALILPLIVFLMSGFNDTLLNYTNEYHLRPEEGALFSMALFGVAALIGSFVVVIQLISGRTRLEWKSLAGGIILGVPNYFSIYFLIKALSFFHNDGAFLFPIVNISIIVASSFFSVILFKEKLSTLNKAGILTAIAAIVMISYQEVIQYFEK